ncbi:unnamed protein product [Nesidiocoris tenuis]|uniref:Uncharacterized protein n=1 Tax=Nesidiocoris tenuis TaxID=355587 RepID=A0A6H5G9F6_9HEMI|nr:unnamed protein product [Nesidiocoris tenuis]
MLQKTRRGEKRRDELHSMDLGRWSSWVDDRSEDLLLVDADDEDAADGGGGRAVTIRGTNNKRESPGVPASGCATSRYLWPVEWPPLTSKCIPSPRHK